MRPYGRASPRTGSQGQTPFWEGLTAAVSPVRGLWQAKRADAAMSAKGGKSGSGYVRPKHMELGDHIDQPMSELLAPWAVRSPEEVSRPRLLISSRWRPEHCRRWRVSVGARPWGYAVTRARSSPDFFQQTSLATSVWYPSRRMS